MFRKIGKMMTNIASKLKFCGIIKTVLTIIITYVYGGTKLLKMTIVS